VQFQEYNEQAARQKKQLLGMHPSRMKKKVKKNLRRQGSSQLERGLQDSKFSDYFISEKTLITQLPSLIQVVHSDLK